MVNRLTPQTFAALDRHRRGRLSFRSQQPIARPMPRCWYQNQVRFMAFSNPLNHASQILKPSSDSQPTKNACASYCSWVGSFGQAGTYSDIASMTA